MNLAVVEFVRARRWWLVTGAVALAALAGYAVYQQAQSAQARAQALASLRSEIIARGNIVATVGATGTLAPEQQANLAFLVPGTVAEVMVESGDVVRAGQVLARLDATEFRLAAQQAADALSVAELNRQKLLAGPSAADIAVAKANVGRANAALADLLKGAGLQQVSIARLQYDQLKEKHRLAAEQYSTLLSLGDQFPYFASSPAMLDDAKAVMDATFLTAEASRLQLQQTQNGADSGARSVAYAHVAQAQAALDQLLAPASDSQIQQADLVVEQARLGLEQAQLRLARADLTAPFAGVIAVVNVKAGEPAPVGAPAMILLDPRRFHLDVAVDEVDVAQLTVGQKVTVTLDALPGATLTGRVDRLAPVATIVSGLVNYTVRLALDPTDAPLRAGMSATADIAVAEVRGVLLVPNWAIRRDRSTGQAYASLKVGGTLREVPIETGLRGESYTEAKSGVHEGDLAAVSTARDPIDLFGGGQ